MKIENTWMLLPDRKVGWGMIEIADGVIKKVVPVDAEGKGSRSAEDGQPYRLPKTLVLPGLVNCHGHTPMTLTRGLGGGLPLQRWLEEAIFPVEAKMTPADVRAGAVWGIVEMLAGGTTSVVDMYDFPAETEAALEAAGMKGNVCRVGLSFVPGRLDDCIAFTRAHPKAHICVHSEYLTDEPFCRGLAKANNEELKRPVHVHVSETVKEHEACVARHGKTPITYLADTGLLDQGGFAAHCVYCTDDDFRIMAAKNVVLVHNPTSNMKLGSGFARIPRALELGVKVALGTDGCASNDNLDMFEEMHLCSLVHKGLAKDPTVLSPWDVIEMATYGHAIKAGAPADLCVIDLDRPHLIPHNSSLIPSLVVHSMHASDVVQTIVDGKVLYDHGKFPTIDVEKAKADLIASVKRIGL